MIRQSHFVARLKRVAMAAQRRSARHTRSLSAVLCRERVFGLKLILSAAGAAFATLVVMNKHDSAPVVAKLYADRYEPSFYPRQSSNAEPVGAFDKSNQVTTSYFPRVVKTQRLLDPQRSQVGAPSAASVTSNIMPNSLKANGVTLEDMQRPDGSLRLRIPLRGSLQNPAWSPDGTSIAFTRFRNGYNKAPADVYVFNLVTNQLQQIAADGSENVSQPGSTWNASTGQIVFSSDRGGHDEIWVANRDGSRRHKVTSRSSHMGYEPSFAPDGHSLVFESHKVGHSGHGRITLLEIGQKRYVELTGVSEDCRQPNWSPRGDYILYQKHVDGQWDIWLYDVRTKQHRSATAGLSGDKTDATFSPDGRYILYSGEVPGRSGESLLALPIEGGQPVAITRHAGYHGAPSWSPDGSYVAMEASAYPPDGSAGTELIITPVQRSTVRLSFDAR